MFQTTPMFQGSGLVLQPSGPPALWSSSCLVLQPSGPPALWSSSCLVLQPSGPPALWSSSCLVQGMSIWVGRVEGPTGDSCCMGVGLFRGLGPAQVWGLGFWAYLHVSVLLFFYIFQNFKKHCFLIKNLQAKW
jgi:hypothetical protein